MKLEQSQLLEEQNELKSLQEELRLHDSTISQLQRDDSSKGRPQTTASSKSLHGSCNDSDDLDFDNNKILDDELKKITEKTGIRHVDSLIERIVTTKEKNFSRYSYITQDLESEIARLETLIVERENELNRLKAEERIHGNDRMRNWEKNEAEKATWISKISEITKKYDEESKKWEDAKRNIKACFQALSLHQSQKDDANEITSGNVMDYLASIEKVRQILPYCQRDIRDLYVSTVTK